MKTMLEEELIKTFQFHKGAIRTGCFRASEIAKNLFQFHKGAIRTREYAVIRAQQYYFNSIKVRLELSI